MNASVDSASRWNERYAGDDYLYGERPNVFLRANAYRLAAGQSARCVADGDGRNSVWLAEHGLAVTAFDFSETAVAKARRLALRRGVSVNFRVSGIVDWPWAEARFDVVAAIFIQFLANEERAAVFQGMKNTLKPGGVFLLEGYRPEELAYGTGGVLEASRLYTRAWLQHMFDNWDVLELREYDTELLEGSAHVGLSALIDLVARKPCSAA
jgi:SAM-dependent methyltransferase